jgi:hypothetical protein
MNGLTEHDASMKREGSTVGESSKPMFRSRVVGRAKHLSGLLTLLCFSALLTASGPHLVHHLLDRDLDHAHSHAHKSKPTDCLVLALVQHTPGTEDASALTTVVFPEVEGVGCEPLSEKLTTPRLILHARSPPAFPRSEVPSNSTELALPKYRHWHCPNTGRGDSL